MPKEVLVLFLCFLTLKLLPCRQKKKKIDLLEGDFSELIFSPPTLNFILMQNLSWPPACVHILGRYPPAWWDPAWRYPCAHWVVSLAGDSKCPMPGTSLGALVGPWCGVTLPVLPSLSRKPTVVGVRGQTPQEKHSEQAQHPLLGLSGTPKSQDRPPLWLRLSETETTSAF